MIFTVKDVTQLLRHINLSPAVKVNGRVFKRDFQQDLLS